MKCKMKQDKKTADEVLFGGKMGVSGSTARSRERERKRERDRAREEKGGIGETDENG